MERNSTISQTAPSSLLTALLFVSLALIPLLKTARLSEQSGLPTMSSAPFFFKPPCLHVFGPKLLSPPLTFLIFGQPNPAILKPLTNCCSIKRQHMIISVFMAVYVFQIYLPLFHTN
jgi:hypothetical protein